MKRVQSLSTLSALLTFGLAFVVRYLYNKKGAAGYFPLHDSLTYQSIAYGILRDHCYCLFPHLPTVDRAPLWPALIALIYDTLGQHDLTVRLFLSVVGSGTCVLIYFFARDLFGGRVALITGMMAAVYPFLFVYDAWLYSESVYIFLLLAFCYVLYHQQRSPRWSLAVFAGVLLGMLSLTRPNGFLLLGLFLLWAGILVWKRLVLRKAFIQTAVVVTLVSLAFVTPWTVRNYMVTKALVPVAVGDGKVLLGSYNHMVLDRPYYLGTWVIPNESVPNVAGRFPAQCSGSCEVTRDTTYKYYARQWIEQNLDKMPYLLWLHTINLWQVTTPEADLAINRFPDRSISHFVVTLMETFTPIVFALAAIGLVVTRKRWRELLFIYMMIGLTVAQSIALYGIARFRAPIEPLLLLLASGALWWLLTLMQRRKKLIQIEQESREVQMHTISGD